MNECGWFSSRISALMHLLRAGVCGYLVTLTIPDFQSSSCQLTSEEMEIVRGIQNGRVTNLLAPYVKRLRDLNSRKPPIKQHTVNGNGDITCGAFTFSKTIWSTIIPRLVDMSKVLFRDRGSYRYRLGSIPYQPCHGYGLDTNGCTRTSR